MRFSLIKYFLTSILNIMNKIILLGTVLSSVLFSSVVKACPYAVYDPPANIRGGPSTAYRVTNTLRYLTQVNVVDKQGAWNRITYPVQGWIHDSQIRPDCTITGPISSPLPRSNSGTSGYCIYKGETVPDHYCY